MLPLILSDLAADRGTISNCRIKDTLQLHLLQMDAPQREIEQCGDDVTQLIFSGPPSCD